MTKKNSTKSEESDVTPRCIHALLPYNQFKKKGKIEKKIIVLVYRSNMHTVYLILCASILRIIL